MPARRDSWSAPQRRDRRRRRARHSAAQRARTVAAASPAARRVAPPSASVGTARSARTRRYGKSSQKNTCARLLHGTFLPMSSAPDPLAALESQRSPLELTFEALNRIRRRWWLVAIFAVTVPASVGWRALHQPVFYSSTMALLLAARPPPVVAKATEASAA